LAVGTPSSGFTGNPKWWNGPDEDLGYVICRPNISGNQPNPDNVPAYITFSRSILKTDQSFINLVNSVFNQTFTTTTQCTSYLTTNNYWTSFVGGVGGGGFVPGDFVFTDGTASPYTANTVTFTKSGTLYIYGTDNGGGREWGADVYLNGTYLIAKQLAATAITQKQTGSGLAFMEQGQYMAVDVNVGNTMYFTIGSGGPPVAGIATITFSINNFSDNGGTVIDTFTNTVDSECYLTTTTVQYKGLFDDGPELTAMRKLREHYMGDEYYENGLIEYYTNSQAIIDGINASEDPSVDYEFIYQSVLKVKNYVDQSMWKEAIDEYIDTYFILKNRYI
jgi:hypothetical protein